MITSSYYPTPLTVDSLVDDTIASGMGVWRLPSDIQGKTQTFLILEEKKGKYVLLTPGMHVVKRSSSLEIIVHTYNEFVAKANSHDLTVVLDNFYQPSVLVKRG